MAAVQYIVLYKYAHPRTKKPITNTTVEKYDMQSRFIKSYPAASVDTAEILIQENSENQKYDMLFMFDGVQEINPLVPGAISASYKVISEKFERCKGEAWFVASVHSSLQSAIKAATPVIKSIGKNNVKVVKNVPMEISVEIE